MAYKGLEFGTLKKVIFIILSLIFEPVNWKKKIIIIERK